MDIETPQVRIQNNLNEKDHALIPYGLIYDASLSLEALGLLIYLHSREGKFAISIKTLCTKRNITEEKFESLMDELELNQYCTKKYFNNESDDSFKPYSYEIFLDRNDCMIAGEENVY